MYMCAHLSEEIDIVISPHFPDERVEGHTLYCCSQCSLYVKSCFWKLSCGPGSCKMGGM